MQSIKAFTITYNGITSVLNCKCGLCEGITVEQLQRLAKHPEIKEVNAIFDTGAEVSSISTKIANELGLSPVGMARNSTAGGIIDVFVYAVNIVLPNRVSFPMVQVTGNDLGDVDMLIGMDIISQGDFSITNVEGKTTFSFRLPSLERIDYTEKEMSYPQIKTKEPGRNDPCPCGSGLKYKKCCGKNK